MKKIIVCNHKMYLTRDESKVLRKKIDTIDTSGIDLIICPNYLNYDVFSSYKLGSQDAFYEDKGSYTGEVSAYDLSLIGVKYSLVGHSERRKYDDNKVINSKIKAILRNSMTPILCVGETRLDRELMRTPEVIKKQLDTALENVKLEASQEIFIAYEPEYLIGGKTALTKKEIDDTITYIKKIVDYYGIRNYKLLYGGSVTSNNISNIKSEKLDGYLIGSSSVDEKELQQIINCIK